MHYNKKQKKTSLTSSIITFKNHLILIIVNANILDPTGY